MLQMRDRMIDLRDVIGPRESRVFERLAEAGDLYSRIAIFEQEFLGSDLAFVEPELERFIAKMRREFEVVPIGHLAAELAWSERRLERVFAEKIGLRPKLYSRILRFQRFLDTAGKGNANLLERALNAGFYDQSHLIKEFRTFTGGTPTEYFGRDLLLTDLFVGS
jgi:AraC-like DNA-binding protein